MAIERSGPLTWAQQEWFADLGADEDTPWLFEANFSATLPGHHLPIGSAVTAVRDLLSRHEGLRTLVALGPDGRREQHVCAVDDLSDVVRIVTEGPAADDAIERASRTSFRLSAQWPILLVLVVERGVVTRIGVVVDHAAIDGWGMRVLCSDLGRALRARGKDREPFDDDAAVEQPLDTALWETGPNGDRHAERAERHWRRQLASLREALDGNAPKSGPAPDAPILHTNWLASAHVARAADAIAAATGVPASAAYLLAFGVAICEVEGADAACVHALTANRLAPGTQLSVRKAVMPALIVVRGDTHAAFAQRLADCASQQLHGHRFANIEPRVAASLSSEILGDLQGSGAVSARFNYVDNSVVGSAANSRSLARDNVAFTDPAVQGVVTCNPPRPGGSRFILSVQHRSAGALLTLACHEDTAWSAAAADMLWHIEDLLVWAAAGDDGPAPVFGRSRP